jgi:hypothetical protein
MPPRQVNGTRTDLFLVQLIRCAPIIRSQFAHHVNVGTARRLRAWCRRPGAGGRLRPLGRLKSLCEAMRAPMARQPSALDDIQIREKTA